MRKWRKYYLDSSVKRIKKEAIDSSFNQHGAAMGNYDCDEAYQNRGAFFKKYFFGYQYKRLEYYEDFLKKHLDKNAIIFSIASGRCANELRLHQEGYNITCSDLKIFAAYEKTKELFPGFEWMEFNALEDTLPDKFNAVMCLSLIYLFNDRELNRFFGIVSAGLKQGDCLILDSAGSPDNLLSFFIHDIYLKQEAALVRIIKFFLTGRLPGIVVKEFGFFRSDREIARIASTHGFFLSARENYAFLTDFRRSLLFNKLIKDGSGAEKIFTKIGKKAPYIRMFKFIKKI